MLKIKDLIKTYPNGRQALQGVTFHLQEGERVVLLGPNGTLLVSGAWLGVSMFLLKWQ